MPKNSGLPNLIIYALEIYENNIFVGTFGDGIYLSQDNGNTWMPKNSGLPSSYIFFICEKGNRVFASLYYGGLYFSQDNGNSWTLIPFTFEGYITSLSVNGNNIFAGTSTGNIYLSEDNGDSWTLLFQANGTVNEFAFKDNQIFVGTYGGGIYSSVNNGISWSQKNIGLTNTNVLPVLVYGNNIITGTWGGGIFLSQDNGDNWNPINSGNSNMFINSFFVSGNYILAGTWDGDVYRAKLSDFVDVNFADSFDYPLFDKGIDENGNPYEITEFDDQHSYLEKNTLYPDHPITSPITRCELTKSVGPYNYQDVGSYFADNGGIHPGEDWHIARINDVGSEIYSVANGTIIRIRSAGIDNGNIIVIEHKLTNNTKIYSLYVHVDIKDGMNTGKIVKKGELIGKITKDVSAKHHLHFEIRTLFNKDLGTWPNGNGLGYYSDIINKKIYDGMSKEQVSKAFNLMILDGIIDASDFIDLHRTSEIKNIDHQSSTTYFIDSKKGNDFYSGQNIYINGLDGPKQTVGSTISIAPEGSTIYVFGNFFETEITKALNFIGGTFISSSPVIISNAEKDIIFENSIFLDINGNNDFFRINDKGNIICHNCKFVSNDRQLVDCNEIQLKVTSLSSGRLILENSDCCDPSLLMAITKNIIIYLTTEGKINITPDQLDNGSFANCGIQSLSVSPSSFSCTDIGSNTVTLTATNASGNTASATAIVTVIDNTPPTVIPKNKTVTLSNGSASITVNDVDDGSSDVCGIQYMSLSPNTFDCTTTGEQFVTLTATDNNNNSTNGTTTVTVVGSVPVASIAVSPEYTVSPGAEKNTIYLGFGSQSVTLTASEGSSYSWSSSPGSYSSSVSNPVVSPSVTTTYTVLITNQYGCTASAQVTINVEDVRSDHNKVYLCHKSGNNTLSVSTNSVQAHLNHGDYLGHCDGRPKESMPDALTSNQNEEVTIDLRQNHPNPFSDQTDVQYFVSQPEHVTMTIIDIYGKEIVKLIDTTVPSGWNSLTVNGSVLANGLYIVKMDVLGKSAAIKIIKFE